ncbi:MAG: glycosyltransferase family 9 protein [Magnetospirillum sp.]|nr:glycosyltransferase family 9 protein [Magnetospirillum sp.]
MKIAALLDPVLRFLLRYRKRKKRADGVLLISSRGPAEMVFLSAVLPRFMRLAKLDESVTLLCRGDAAGMAFLFPRFLKIRRIDFRRLDEIEYRWSTFTDLHNHHYRLIVSLDYVREHDQDEALIITADPSETAGMVPPPFKRNFHQRLEESEKVFDLLFDSGPVRQDKIVRWSRFADEILDDRQPPQLALLEDSQLPPAEAMPDTIMLLPFSGVKQRMLPAETWRLLVDQIPPHWQVLVAGHKNDFDKYPEYMSLITQPNVRIETSGFEKLASILMGTRLVVGVDTAGLHLAVLLGIPTLCMASAAYVGAGVPYDERVVPSNVQFVYVPMECQGCLGRCKFPLEDGMYRCVNQIDTDQVLAFVRDSVARGVF